jgi:hypothetical protein
MRLLSLLNDKLLGGLAIVDKETGEDMGLRVLAFSYDGGTIGLTCEFTEEEERRVYPPSDTDSPSLPFPRPSNCL